jgi:transcriptional regulator with XRE-family HTH domain
MMYYEKLKKFFKDKKVSNRKLAEITGNSDTMISRYLNGKDRINSAFITIVVENFPDIDLQYIFTDNYEENKDEINKLEEPRETYMNVDRELKNIEDKIGLIRTHLAKKTQE